MVPRRNTEQGSSTGQRGAVSAIFKTGSGKTTEGAYCAPFPDRGKKCKGLEVSKNKGKQAKTTDHEDFGFCCDFRMRYTGEEFGPRKFRTAV